MQLSHLFIAPLLVAATVVMHAVGFSLIVRSLTKSRAAPPTQAWPIAWLLISVTWILFRPTKEFVADTPKLPPPATRR